MSHWFQLLEEVNDAGYPFNLEPNILEEMVRIPSLLSETTDMIMGPAQGFSNLLPNGQLTQIPWRKQGVTKTTNEIYIDILEEIDATVERYLTTTSASHLYSNGSLVYSKISGVIEVDSQLGGLPDLVLKLTGIHGIDDVGYGQLLLLDSSQTIVFILACV